MHLVLSLTHNCNCACTYCYAGEKSAVAMPISVARKSIDYALAQSPDTLEIGFFGGEPLLAWDVLCRSVDYATYRCNMFDIPVQFSITTNGTLVTQSIAAYLDEHAFSIAVSIDGSREMHDANRHFVNGTSSYDAVIAGLKRVQHYRPIEVIAVAAPDTIDLLPDSVAALIGANGISSITINPDFYVPWNNESFTRIENAYERLADCFIAQYRAGTPLYLSPISNKLRARVKGGLAFNDLCGFGINEFAIAPSGNIYPCERLIGSDTSDASRIGNVFSGIDQNRLALLQQHPADDNHTTCTSCTIATICQHQCGCINYRLTGSASVTDGVVCIFERAAAKAADRAGKILFNEGNSLFLRDFYDEPLQNDE